MRSTPLTTVTRSAPTTEMLTMCRTPARDAAGARLRAFTSSPRALPARCTIVSTPSTARSTPTPVDKSPVTYSMPSAAAWLLRLSMRTSAPAARSRGTTLRPSVPVPPVTRIGDVMVSSTLGGLLQAGVAIASGGFRRFYRYDTPYPRDVTSHRVDRCRSKGDVGHIRDRGQTHEACGG